MINDSFPHWIEALSELQVLVLRSNKFHGPITAPTRFEIELMKILTIFTSIDLSSNNFEGQIPRDIGELSSLRGLNLSHNNLVGHIPSSLRNMTRLEWLDLSSNKLSGQIPTGLLDLTFLSSFNVSYNQLRLQQQRVGATTSCTVDELSRRRWLKA
ncbi:hypothetical protein Gohar_016848 [Gossypium harknessii]|uniref:Uncharacterized protein n=1 Tax=Gossypium harknessii TaxID=34285 RepID=A0A7J9G444_9ROSI|nr:hypothetical protein [Gossypium harknessii]